MKLTSLHVIDNSDWTEIVSRPDQIKLAADDALQLLTALRESIIQLKNHIAPPRFKALIRFSNGSSMNVLIDAQNISAATREAEQIASEYEFSIVESIYEIPKHEVIR